MQRETIIRQLGSATFLVLKEEEIGGFGEVIFIEIIEFDLGLEGCLTCIWRKGSRGGQMERPFIHLFIEQIYLEPLCTRPCSPPGHTVENKMRVLPFWNLHSSSRRQKDNKQVNTTWKI